MEQISVYYCKNCDYMTKKRHEVCPKCNGEKTDEVYITKSGKKLSGKALQQFEAFWKAFNYKKGKADAAEIWFKLYRNIDFVIFNRILRSAEKEAYHRSELIMHGRTPIMAQGWLHGRRWEDEYKTEKKTNLNNPNI